MFGTIRLQRQPSPPARHSYFFCDECGTDPILGVRYKSRQYANYDICADCLEANHDNDASQFIVINEPEPLSQILRDNDEDRAFTALTLTQLINALQLNPRLQDLSIRCDDPVRLDTQWTQQALREAFANTTSAKQLSIVVDASMLQADKVATMNQFLVAIFDALSVNTSIFWISLTLPVPLSTVPGGLSWSSLPEVITMTHEQNRQLGEQRQRQAQQQLQQQRRNNHSESTQPLHAMSNEAIQAIQTYVKTSTTLRFLFVKETTSRRRPWRPNDILMMDHHVHFLDDDDDDVDDGEDEDDDDDDGMNHLFQEHVEGVNLDLHGDDIILNDNNHDAIHGEDDHDANFGDDFFLDNNSHRDNDQGNDDVVEEILQDNLHNIEHNNNNNNNNNNNWNGRFFERIQNEQQDNDASDGGGVDAANEGAAIDGGDDLGNVNNIDADDDDHGMGRVDNLIWLDATAPDLQYWEDSRLEDALFDALLEAPSLHTFKFTSYRKVLRQNQKKAWKALEDNPHKLANVKANFAMANDHGHLNLLQLSRRYQWRQQWLATHSEHEQDAANNPDYTQNDNFNSNTNNLQATHANVLLQVLASTKIEPEHKCAAVYYFLRSQPAVVLEWQWE